MKNKRRVAAAACAVICALAAGALVMRAEAPCIYQAQSQTADTSMPETGSRSQAYVFIDEPAVPSGGASDMSQELVDTEETCEPTQTREPEPEPERYLIQFRDWDGTILKAQSVPSGDMPDCDAVPVREGHRFTGWDKELEPAACDTVYTAAYVPELYEITFLSWDGSVLASGQAAYQTVPEAPSVPDRDGEPGYEYRFTGWDKELAPATGPAAYTAVFERVFIGCNYCGAADHKEAVCLQKTADRGAAGRWSIPGHGVDVACFHSNAQSVVNDKDSAAMFPYGVQTIICDHWNQGFEGIKSCEPGTKALWTAVDGTESWYVCTEKFNGHNTGKLTDEDYVCVSDRNENGITCYTCNDNYKNVTIVFFQPA